MSEDTLIWSVILSLTSWPFDLDQVDLNTVRHKGALKMTDMKMADQIARHQNAGHENEGHEIARHDKNW